MSNSLTHVGYGGVRQYRYASIPLVWWSYGP
jgi:hypothetical protein